MLLRSLLVLVAGIALPSVCLSCPTALNIVPSADVVGARGYALQLELDGHATPLSGGAEAWLMTQWGVAAGVEVGVDLADATDGKDLLADAKWQVVAEGERTPAVAVGGLDLFDGADCRAWYAVASMSPKGGSLRLSAGAMKDDCWRGLAGAQWDVDDMYTVYADWISGPGAYAAVGVWRALSSELGVQVYHARCNTDEEEGFVGLNFTYCGEW
jgi:hypothetical protein